jgi:hypothetical protein
MTPQENMHFERRGKTVQLRIRTARDLQTVLALDEALWVATNAPIAAISSDETFLQGIDIDRNGRITTHDLQKAIRWTLETLSNPSALEEGADRLCLKDLDERSPEGRRILEGCRLILQRLGRDESQSVRLPDGREILAREQSLPVSETGVALPAAAEKPEMRQFLADVVRITGGVEHPSGARGVNTSILNAFLWACRSRLDWQKRGRLAEETREAIMPLGAETHQSYAVVHVLSPKIDSYFAQCEALALDPQYQRRMGITEAELDQYDFDDPSAIQEMLATAPIARARPDRILTLREGVNPYYAQTLEEFRNLVLPALLEQAPDELTAAQWLKVKSFFAAHRKWKDAGPDGPIADLDEATLRAYLEEPYARRAQEIIAESVGRSTVLENLRRTEKLLLHLRYLMELANNLVSFPHLYDPSRKAMLQMGTLVIDGRRLNLAVRVLNRAEHVKVAQMSYLYVLYVEIHCPDEKEPYEVAVPVTSGNKGNLCVGKRGVFFDVNGRECDARVVHVLENPISVREALWSPFRRISQMVMGKIEAITGEAEKSFEARSSGALAQLPGAPPGPGPAASPEPPNRPAPGGGLIVGGGLMVAALTSAVAYISNTLFRTPLLYILGVLGSAIALVLVPIAILALLKLRRRDLSAILEGSGWGINARMRLTLSQKRYFTQRPGAGSLAGKLKWWVLAIASLLALASIILWVLGA